ncbi:MAG: hypothetical protein IK147_04545 [Clostridia bacterium]|nr:hypothetical protein [Clostridia bacterium]
MKKFLIFICIAVSLFSTVSFYGCENKENGTIDGNYVPVTEESYERIVGLMDGENPVAGSETAFGGTLSSDVTADFTIGESSARISVTETLKLQYLNELLKASLTGGVTVSADETFPDALIGMIAGLFSGNSSEETSTDIGEINATGNVSAFLDDTVTYLNAKITGLTERQKELLREEGFDVDELGIESGIKYRFTDTDVKETALETVWGAVGFISEAIETVKTLDYQTVNDYATLFDIGFDIDEKDDGFTVRLTTSETTAEKLRAWANEEEGDLKDFFETVSVNNLDVALYLSFDGYGKLVKIAVNGDVALSFTAGETPVTARLSGNATLSFSMPKIDFPSFDDYVDPAGENDTVPPADETLVS